MKIIKFKKAAMEILDFEKQYNLELTVYERDPEAKDLPRYYAHFDSADTKVGKCCLLGEHGDGNTPEEAIKDYCRKISNKTLVIDAMSATNRREIKVPELQQTKDLRPTEEGFEAKEEPKDPQIERLRKHFESTKLPLSAYVLPANKRLIEELKEKLQQHLDVDKTKRSLESEGINFAKLKAKYPYARIIAIPIDDNLLPERIRQILIKYAGQVENEPPFIHLSGI